MQGLNAGCAMSTSIEGAQQTLVVAYMEPPQLSLRQPMVTNTILPQFTALLRTLEVDPENQNMLSLFLQRGRILNDDMPMRKLPSFMLNSRLKKTGV
jgi:hypothetical protein